MRRFFVAMLVALSTLSTPSHSGVVDYIKDQISAYLTPLTHQILLTNAVFAPLHLVGLGAATQLIKMRNGNTSKMEHVTEAVLASMGGAFTAITPAYIAARTLPLKPEAGNVLVSTLLKRGAIAGLTAYETGRFTTYSSIKMCRLATQVLTHMLSSFKYPLQLMFMKNF